MSDRFCLYCGETILASKRLGTKFCRALCREYSWRLTHQATAQGTTRTVRLTDQGRQYVAAYLTQRQVVG